MDCPHIPKVSYTEFSERIHRKVMRERIPIDGTIELTLHCNLHCPHCYCVPDCTKKELSFKEICRILDEISDAGCLWLLITGGEPLLRPDFLDIYTYAKKKGMIITLFTNGTLLTHDIADYLKDYPPFVIEITLYGATKETYEKITQASGSFVHCLKGIHLLLERKLPLKLKTVLMTLNKHELWQMKKYARDLGVEFRFDPLLNPKLDDSKEPCKLRISPLDVLEFDLADEKRVKEWREFYRRYSVSLSSDLLYTCGAGRNSFHIDPCGNLSVCMISRFPSYNLSQGSFKEGWNDFIPNKILSLKQIDNYECARCNLNNLCDRCPGWSQLELGNFQSDEPIEYLCRIAHLRAEAFGFGINKVKDREEVNG